MWIARIARTGAIYDASVAAQAFHGGRIVGLVIGNGDFAENEEKGSFGKKERRVASKRHVFESFYKKSIESQ